MSLDLQPVRAEDSISVNSGAAETHSFEGGTIMARHGNRALLVALLLLAAAVLVPGGALSDSAPQVRYPDPDIGVDSLAARKKAQTDTADQFKVFYQFHF